MERLITSEELAKILSIPQRQVWEHVRRGQIPCYRVGRLYRFDLEVVLAALRMEAEP